MHQILLFSTCRLPIDLFPIIFHKLCTQPFIHDIDHFLFGKVWRVHNFNDIIDQRLLDDFVDHVGTFKGGRRVDLDQVALTLVINHDVVTEKFEGGWEGWD